MPWSGRGIRRHPLLSRGSFKVVVPGAKGGAQQSDWENRERRGAEEKGGERGRERYNSNFRVAVGMVYL